MYKKLVGIVVFGLLFATAIPAIGIVYKCKPLKIDNLKLEIKVKGVLLGYTVTVTNTVNESANGSLNIKIITDAWFMLAGAELDYNFDNLSPNESVEFNMKPVLGFGPANINLEARFTYENGDYAKDSINTKGFVFLFYVSCSIP